MLCWIVSIIIFHRCLLTSTTGLETRLWNLAGRPTVYQGQFTLKEQEELVSVPSDRTMKLKHAELNLDAFWILVKNEYPAIAEKALRLLLQFSTSYMCKFGFSAMTTIKHKKRERLLSVEDELRVSLLNIRPRIKLLCSHQDHTFEITKHTFRTEMFATANWCYTGNNKVTRVTSNLDYLATRVYF